MMPHTPEPWEAMPDGDVTVIVSNEQHGPVIVATIGDDDADDIGSRENNARLITAAPDLLAALKSMCHRFGHLATDPGKHEAVNATIAAIAKATGD